MTVRAKKGGKGNASCNARLADSSFAVNHVSSLSVTSTSYFDYQFGATFPSGFSNSDVNTLFVRLDTTGGTQVFISEIFVTIDYTAAASGPANLTSHNGIAKASITSINGIAIANITTLNGIS